MDLALDEWCPGWWTQQDDLDARTWEDFDCGPMSFDEAWHFAKGMQEVAVCPAVPMRVRNIRTGQYIVVPQGLRPA